MAWITEDRDDYTVDSRIVFTVNTAVIDSDYHMLSHSSFIPRPCRIKQNVFFILQASSVI